MAAELPPLWEKLKVVSLVTASLMIPLVVAYLGNAVSKDQKDKEIGVRYVELAVGILRTEPNPQTKSLREWAVSVIDHYSQVPLPKEARDELQFQQLFMELKAEAQRLSVEQQRASEELDKMHRSNLEEIEKLRRSTGKSQ
jgi:hypothetical protein